MAHTSFPSPWGHTSPVGRPPGLPQSLRTCRHKSVGRIVGAHPSEKWLAEGRGNTLQQVDREERLPGRERTRGKGRVPALQATQSLPLPSVCPGTRAVWVGGLSAVGSGYACTGGRPEAHTGKRLPTASTPAPPGDPRASTEKSLLPLRERGRCKDSFVMG